MCQSGSVGPIRLIAIAGWVIAALAFASSLPAEDSAFSVDEFERLIRPLLVDRCMECHQGAVADGDLQVTSRETLLQGGMGGASIVPGDPDASSLLLRVRSEDEDQQMPPDERLSDEEIGAIEAWIRGGAVWPTGDAEGWHESDASGDAPHWAFQPLSKPTPPQPNDIDARTPVDQFIAARLHDAGIQPVGEASRETLVRRATWISRACRRRPQKQPSS